MEKEDNTPGHDEQGQSERAPRLRAPRDAMSARAAAGLAAVCYLAVALFLLRPVLSAPTTTFAFPERVERNWVGIIEADQKLTATVVTANAAHWTRAPWHLWESRQCFPVPRAVALGEHMFGAGLLGAVPALFGANPVLTYNVAVALNWWIAALAMYALVSYWTASAGAAFVAGLLFAFHPTRILDLVHLYVPATQWTPLALLFAHRLFAHRRWRDAAGLAAMLVLQLLESVYTVLALGLVGGVVGLWLLVRHAAALPILAPRLVAVALAAAGAAAAIFGPYLEMRDTWGTLAGREPVLHGIGDFGRGGGAFPGTLMLFLVLVALVDRVRGRREHPAGDPRVVYAVAGLTVLWASVMVLPIPFTGRSIPSLFVLAMRAVPGLDAVRAGGALRCGVYVMTAVLAGFGVRAMLDRHPTRRGAVAGVLAVLFLVEVLWPPAAIRSFGAPTALRPYQPGPWPMERTLYDRLAPGAVLDFPLAFRFGEFFHNASYAWASAFHGHDVGACYNSFVLPVQEQIAALAARLPHDPRAADALGALGFTNVLWHTFLIGRRNPVPPVPRPLPPPLVERAKVGTATLLGIEPRLPVETRIDLLAVQAELTPSTPSLTVTPSADSATVDVMAEMRNGGTAVFRHPDPIVPTALAVVWHDGQGRVVRQEEVRALLPIALAPGDALGVRLSLHPPPSGDYVLTVAPAATPSLVLVRAAARVLPSAAAPAAQPIVPRGPT